jgi:hypothetical protein
MKFNLKRKSYSLSDVSDAAPTPDNKSRKEADWNQKIRSLLSGNRHALKIYLESEKDSIGFGQFVMSNYGYYAIDNQDVSDVFYDFFDGLKTKRGNV